jgi:hypothetical protein
MNIASTPGGSGELYLRNCKLPANWAGSLSAATPGPGCIIEMANCDSADTNYRYWRETTFGSIKHETTIVRTDGASDGTTALSWRMASNADADNYPHSALASPEIVKWNDTTGSAVTITVEILHDSVTDVTDRECWLEVDYLGTSGFPLSSRVSDGAADVLATAAGQTTSSATWTTTGLTNPNEQKLAVTFTPQEKGYLHARVMVAKASYTVFVDPLLTVS